MLTLMIELLLMLAATFLLFTNQNIPFTVCQVCNIRAYPILDNYSLYRTKLFHEKLSMIDLYFVIISCTGNDIKLKK